MLGLQIFVSMRLGRHIEEDGEANKYSLATLVLCNIQDFLVMISEFQFLISQ